MAALRYGNALGKLGHRSHRERDLSAFPLSRATFTSTRNWVSRSSERRI